MAQPASLPLQSAAPAAAGDLLRVRAFALGERIDTRHLRGERATADAVIVRAGQRGHLTVFRYGSVVLFDLSAEEERHELAELARRVSEPFAHGESEAVELTVDSARIGSSGDAELVLKNRSLERLLIVAEVMAKSVMLAQYEASLAAVFDAIEPLAIELERHGRVSRDGGALVRHIGSALLAQHRMVGRIEVGEKPDLLWDHPELERLHARLVDEYELTERQAALERKLELVSRTAEVILNLLYDRRSLRVEWYIVILIVAEIAISLYQIVAPLP